MKTNMKIIVSIIVLTIILINMSLINAAPASQIQSSSSSTSISKQIFNFFNNFSEGTQGFLISLLPLAFLIIISYIFIRKGGRTLIAVQWLLWMIYAVYMLAKAFAFANIYYNWNILPLDYSAYLVNPLPSSNTEAYKWFIYSMISNAVVSLLFSFKNNWLVAVFLRFRNKPSRGPAIDYQI